MVSKITKNSVGLMMKGNNQIRELEKLAEEVGKLKESHRQKRPIIIEFCGAPKAGKTACLNSLGDFLKRNGFRVKIISEAASICPVVNKESPSFNIWTAMKAIAGLMEELESSTKADFVFFDRGIFDALCWFKWHHFSDRISDDEMKMLQTFLTNERFVKYIDIVFVFDLTPEESLKREYLNLLTLKPGSIMNTKVLSAYRKSVRYICDESLIPNIIDVDGGNYIEDNIYEVTKMALEKLRDILMEKIGYIPRDDLKRIFNTNKTFSAAGDFSASFRNLRFGPRKEIEANSDYIQPIPIAVIANEDRTKVLVIRKNESNTGLVSPELKKDLLYVGGHIRIEDMLNWHCPIMDIFKNALVRELNEELGISVSKDLLRQKPAVFYTPDGDKSDKHVAICFFIQLSEDTKFHLDANELVLNRGKSKSGRFVDVRDIIIDPYSLEDWSKLIMKTYFGLKVLDLEDRGIK